MFGPVQHETVWLYNLIWQLAVREPLTPNGETGVCSIRQPLRMALGWHSDDYPLTRKSLSNRLYRGYQITVGGNDHGCVESIIHRVRQQVYSDVHIRHFFFRLLPRCVTPVAGLRLAQVLTKNDIHSGKRLQGFKIDLLSHMLVGIKWVAADSRREIMRSDP